MILRPQAGGVLSLLGINHTSAPLEVRERLAIAPARLSEATRDLVRRPGVREGLILSTCNRVELLTSVDPEATGPEDAPLEFLHEYFALKPGSLQPHLYIFREQEAVRHLFRVASSLDSLVVGEAQILGQVKASWQVARDVGAVSGTLDPLLQRAFSVAKRVRTETEIGSSSVSIASVAVDLARKIFGTLRGKQVLLVGAGKMSELAARHLVRQGAAALFVANRTELRARQLASELGSELPTQTIAFEHLHEQAHRADIVITSTGAGRIFHAAHGRMFLERRRHRPMFFIDIAFPRDVDPDLNNVEGCFVYDIDDLQQSAATHRALRSREARAAETIVSAEVERYQQQQGERSNAPAIRALQQSAEHLRQGEMERTLNRLQREGVPLSQEQLAALQAMTRSLVGKLLHPQIAMLRQNSDGSARLVPNAGVKETDDETHRPAPTS